jgi:glyoxylase I family protein
MPVEFQGIVPLLQVFDMPAALAFYVEKLDFLLKGSSGAEPPFDWVWLERNGTEVMLNTMYEADARPEAPDSMRTQQHDDVTLFFSCRDLDGLRNDLLSRGLTIPEAVKRDYGMTQLWLKDPDGYGLCFQWRTE